MQTQLRIEGDGAKLIFKNKTALKGYLKNLLEPLSKQAKKDTQHLPLVEFYKGDKSVIYRDYSELPKKTIEVDGVVLVTITNDKR